MIFSEFVFAAVPPALAIAIEGFSLPSGDYLKAKAVERQKLAALPEAASDMIHQMSMGAVSMSSIAPTLITLVTTVFAIFGTEPNAVFYDFGCVVFAILMTLCVVKLLSKYGPYELTTNLIKLPFKMKIRNSHYLPVTRAKVLHWGIYLTNALLIVASIAVYRKWLS